MSPFSPTDERAWSQHSAFWRPALERAQPFWRLEDPSRELAQTRAGSATLEHFETLLECSGQLVRRSAGDPAARHIMLVAALALVLSKYSHSRQLALLVPPMPPDPDEPATPATRDWLPLLFEVAREGSFKDWVKQAQESIADAYQFQDFPLERLDSGFAQPAWFSNLLLIDREFHECLRSERVQLESELTLTFSSEAAGIRLRCDYQSERFSVAFIKDFCLRLDAILAHYADTEQPLARCSMLLPHEQERAVLRGPRTAFPMRNLVALFEAQVQQTPDALALIAEQTRLTYAELNRQAANLAVAIGEQLQDASQRHVGLLLEKSPNSLIAILAVLKAGAAYVPLDPAYPAERLRTLLQDAGCELLIIESQSMFAIEDYEGSVFVIDLQSEDLLEAPPFQAAAIQPQDSAYLIYTSGSTGTPKGVQISHAAIANTIQWRRASYAFRTSDRVLQFASLSFDSSVEDLFTPLSSGAALVLPLERRRTDPSYLIGLIESQQITHLLLVPSLYRVLLEAYRARLTGLRAVTVAGEACPRELVERHFELLPQVALVNEYGPTENAVCSSALFLEPGQSGPVGLGAPISNCELRILDPQLALLPPGLFGELALSGAGLADGYWRRPELSAARFLNWPAEPELRLYLSGDLARIAPDGSLLFLGRKDDQLKINGFRLEPGEIEHLIQTLPGVSRAVVRAAQLPNGRRLLCCWYKASPALAESALLEQLRAKLPAHFIPNRAIALEHFPTTPNGKLDLAALPLPAESSAEPATQTKQEAPARDGIEAQLITLWQKVLNLPQLGIDDDFFALDGDSILVIQLVSQINATFGQVIEVEELFHHSTIAKLAPLIRQRHSQPKDSPKSTLSSNEQSSEASDSLDKLLRFQAQIQQFCSDWDQTGWEEILPMSDSEQGFAVQSLAHPEGGVYHDQFCFDFIDSDFAFESFAQALATLYRRHQILRSSFHLLDVETPFHLVHRAEHVRPELSYADMRRLEPEQQLAEIEALMRLDRARPFQLSQPGLLRFKVLRRGEQRYTLFNASHHLILDGWSHNLLLDEWFLLYAQCKQGGGLPDPRPAPALRSYLSWPNQEQPELRAFWKHKLADAVRLPLPLQRRFDPARAAEVREWRCQSEPALAQALADRARQLQVPRKHLHLAAFSLLLARFCSIEDLTLGLVHHLRPHSADAERLIGNFITTLPFRIQLREQASVRDWIALVHGEALAHQAQRCSLSAIAHMLGESHSLPFFDLLFNYIDFRRALSPVEPGNATAILETGVAGFEATAYPLEFKLAGGDEPFSLTITYATASYEARDVRRLGEAYLRILEGLTGAPEQRLSELAWCDPEELSALAARLRGPDWPLPGPKQARTIDALFSQRASLQPNDIALVAEGRRLSFAEVERQSTALAQLLRQDYHLRQGQIVALELLRDEWLPLLMLALFKCGAAYLALDPKLPAQRREELLADSGASLLIRNLAALDSASNSASFSPSEPDPGTESMPVLQLEALKTRLEHFAERPQVSATQAEEPDPERPAYLMYTSGSTGKPKGVLICHRNLLNFFHAMDGRVGLGEQDALLAVTQTTFDISVLELLWTLCAGVQVVIRPDSILASNFNRFLNRSRCQLDFSLFFFSSNTDLAQQRDPYDLLLSASRFADSRGFKAVWTPERHFHPFGALFPNPSVTSAAIAACTQRIQIRAGSLVAPLHHPIRIAEEWAAVDQISRGRVGLSFASGWHPNDFALAPAAFQDRKALVYQRIEEVRKLWRGEALELETGNGTRARLRAFPQPCQKEIPIWLTAASDPSTFAKAGAMGANILTHLLGKELDSLAEPIAAYRAARAENGHDPQAGTVTLMIHTYLGEDEAAVKAAVEAPLKSYLASSIDLAKMAEHSGFDYEELSPAERELMLHGAFERYYEQATLIGTPLRCAARVEELYAIGVTELACLVDFGLPRAQVEQGLELLARFQESYRPTENASAPHANASPEVTRSPTSRAEQAPLRPITSMQATPSLLRLLLADPDSRLFLQSLKTLLVGGEPMTPDLLRQLQRLPARILNMYGPTETTIWSSVHLFGQDGEILIGEPIENTQFWIVDPHGRALPPEVVGELLIGGEGVCLGYHNRPQLNRERFIANPSDGKRAYRSGDLAYARRSDGALILLGRNDHQIKFNGMRIELGEIEQQLGACDKVRQAVVLLQTIAGQQQLVAHIAAAPELDLVQLRQQLSASLPAALVPGLIQRHDSLPLMANGKLDRRRLATIQPEPKAPTTSHFSPSEAPIAQAWAVVLQHDNFGPDHNFFSVGGNSIALVKLQHQLSKTPHNLSLVELLQRPTIRQQAEKRIASHQALDQQDPLLIPLTESQPNLPDILLLPSSLADPAEFQHLAVLWQGANLIGADLFACARAAQQPLSIAALARLLIQAWGNRPQPLFVLGYSFGVKFALELSQHWSAKGAPPPLALLDGNLNHSIQASEGQQASASPAEQLLTPQQRELVAQLRQAESQYKGPAQVSAPLYCIQAQNTPGLDMQMERLRALTPERFECQFIDATHTSLLKAPAVHKLSALLHRFQAQCQQRASSQQGSNP